MSKLTFDRIDRYIRKNNLYRNMKSNNIVTCLGYFPNALSPSIPEDGVVIISPIWSKNFKSPSAYSIKVTEFLREITVLDPKTKVYVGVKNFVRLEKPDYQKPIQPIEIQRLHEFEAKKKKLNN